MFGNLEAKECPPGKDEGPYLAVYGTLAPGGDNHWVIEGLVARNYARMQYRKAYLGGLCLVDINGLPAAYIASPHLKEHGEIWRVGCTVYRIDRGALHTLDMFEGHPAFYRRMQTSAYQIQDGRKRNQIAVFAYFGPRAGNGFIGTGQPVGNLIFKPEADSPNIKIGCWAERGQHEVLSIPCEYLNGEVTFHEWNPEDVLNRPRNRPWHPRDAERGGGRDARRYIAMPEDVRVRLHEADVEMMHQAVLDAERALDARDRRDEEGNHDEEP